MEVEQIHSFRRIKNVEHPSAMLGTRYRCFAALSEGGPMLLRCGTLHSTAQCCTVSHSATAC